VAWKDAEGDVRGLADLPERPTPDLREIVIRSENGELIGEFEVKNLAKRLAFEGPEGRRYGTSLLDLLVDADHDPATGGAPGGLWRGNDKPSRFGYEFRIAVLAGFRYQSADGGSGRSTGDVSMPGAGKTAIEPIVIYQVWSLGAQRSATRHVALPDADKDRMDRELATLEGDRVRIRVPYGILGVKPGARLRIAYHDVLESATQESALSTDQSLTLR
jgi:hypothetical protein